MKIRPKLDTTTLTRTRLFYVAEMSQVIEVEVYRNFGHWLEGNRETAIRSYRTEGRHRVTDSTPWDVDVDVDDLFPDNIVVVRIISSYYSLHDDYRQHFYGVECERDDTGLIKDQFFRMLYIDMLKNYTELPE